MSRIIYVVGDATEPQGNDGGMNIIVHCCNDKGGWGAGFVMAISKKWPEPEERYRRWFTTGYKADSIIKPLELGDIQNVMVDDTTGFLYVCNLIGQHDTRPDSEGISPIRYDAIFRGLTRLQRQIERSNGSRPIAVHMPRMGAGLAGGDWNIIEAIVKSTLTDKGIPVIVYDFVP